MGVPKFFRWLSERYPKMNQRVGSPPDPETCHEHFPNKLPPPPFEEPDPLSTCGLQPRIEIDRLYLDMNGIIHGCSHNNSNATEDDGGSFDTVSKITHEEIFQNVCYYLDRVVGDIVQPKEVVYMAIDGVAPRAKLNQQRSRRYRSGTEGEIETNIYDAHLQSLQKQQQQIQDDGLQLTRQYNEDGYSFVASSSFDDGDDDQDVENITVDAAAVHEIAPGRFKGKFETQAQIDDLDGTAFHSNVITPGTPFFQSFTHHLERFVKRKLSTDPKWKHLTIIFSGPNVPGEGEHKLMQFIREQKQRPDYNPNLRHCIMGQDGDLILLGLATHEPNLVLLRERVVFNMTKRRLQDSHHSTEDNTSLDAYIHNPHFEFLHMGVLRDYLAYEFETSNVLASSPWNIERVLDDFVFMTFFVGNDFLPHMPALDIADHAFDLLFFTYKQCRMQWLEEWSESGGTAPLPYLTNAGTIVSGKRLQQFLSQVGAHEISYYDKKKQTALKENQWLRKESKKHGWEATIPEDHVLESKEQSDRAAYRAMLQQTMQRESKDTLDFAPVLTETVVEFQPVKEEREDDLISRMGSLLQNSLSSGGDDDSENSSKLWTINDQDLKGRYYYDKFQFTPFDQEKHLALRKAYMEGLVWTLTYYYQGCVSWEWFYPYHYGTPY